MPTLKEQIRSVRKELKIGKEAEEAKHIIEECEVIYQKLSGPQAKLRKLIRNLQSLQSIPSEHLEDLHSSEDLANQTATCRHSIESFKVRWNSEGHSARSAEEFANAQASLDSLMRVLGEVIDQCWQSWVEHINSRVEVENIKLETQKNLPGYEAIYKDYVNSRERLNRLLESVPTESSVILHINELCQGMVDLKGQMHWSVDSEIADFFDRLDRDPSGKVPLSLLSKKVMEWLEEHGYLDHFVIQRRGRKH